MLKLLQKFVLTGGPCTGKTTLLQALDSLGYQTVPEAATILIKQKLESGQKDIFKDLVKFQKDLFEKQLELEAKIKLGSFAFIDRGVIDGIAYCKFYKVKPPKELIEYALNNKYDGVFFLKFLPNYGNSVIRHEPFNVALKLHETLRKTYEEFNYRLIEVPDIDIASRIEFICDKVKNYVLKKSLIKEINI